MKIAIRACPDHLASTIRSRRGSAAQTHHQTLSLSLSFRLEQESLHRSAWQKAHEPATCTSFAAGSGPAEHARTHASKGCRWALEADAFFACFRWCVASLLEAAYGDEGGTTVQR